MFGQDSLEQGDERDRASGMKIPDAGVQGCSWKRRQRMPTCYGSAQGFAAWGSLTTDCHVSFQPVPGPREDLTRCSMLSQGISPFTWRPHSLAGGAPRACRKKQVCLLGGPPLFPVHLTGGRLLHSGRFRGGGCSGHLCIYAQMYPSLPLDLSLSSGWCRWSSNPLPKAAVLFLVSPAPWRGGGIKTRKNKPKPMIGFYPAICTQGEAVECHV